MRNIVSPLDGLRSPFGTRSVGGGSPVPPGAIYDRSGSAIVDRSGNYIQVRA